MLPMDLWLRIGRGGILAALFIFVALPPMSAARGQQTAGAPPTKFEPVASAPPLLDPDLFKLPQLAPNYDLDKLDLSRFRKEAPEFALPDRIDLGSYMLHLDTSRKGIDSAPRAGIDSGETSNLNSVLPTPKQSSIIPNYFGLKLTTPMH